MLFTKLAPVLVLLPAPLAQVTPRCAAPASNLNNLLGDFVSAGNEKAENAKQVQNLLSLVTRAAASRGKADLDAVRAFATMLGVGGDLGNLEASLGISSTNTTDPSGALVQKMMEGLGSAVASKLESPRERQTRLALAVGLSVVLCETFQMALLLSLSWLVGAGLSAGGSRPFAAAFSVALKSRAMTRPLRLIAELWVADSYRRALMDVPPRGRRRSAMRNALVRTGALASLCILLTSADAALYTAGAWGAPDVPLAKILCIFSGAILQPLLRFLGLSKLALPDDVRRTTGAACAFVRARARDAADLSERLSDAAMDIKPLRALLELSETDAWLGSVCAAAPTVLSSWWPL